MSRRAFCSLIVLALAAGSPGATAEGAAAGPQTRDSGQREVAVFAGG